MQVAVTNIVHPALVFTASLNHDPDADSDGRAIDRHREALPPAAACSCRGAASKGPRCRACAERVRRSVAGELRLQVGVHVDARLGALSLCVDLPNLAFALTGDPQELAG